MKEIYVSKNVIIGILTGILNGLEKKEIRCITLNRDKYAIFMIPIVYIKIPLSKN